MMSHTMLNVAIYSTEVSLFLDVIHCTQWCIFPICYEFKNLFLAGIRFLHS